jgi:adenylate cyclase
MARSRRVTAAPYEVSRSENNARAQTLFRRSADLDPNFSPAFQGLVYCIMDNAVLYLRHSMAAALELAEPMARKAVVLDPTDAGGYIALAYIHFGHGNLTASLAAAEQALELNPNCAGAYWSKSGNLVYLGRYAEAVEAATTYLRLSPRDLRNWRVLNHLTLGRYLTGDYVGAIEAANQALRLNPNQPLTSRWLAAALGQLGRIEEALRVIAQAGAVLAPVTFDSYALTRGNWLRPEAHAILLEGLHKGGWSPAAASQSAEAEAG